MNSETQPDDAYRDFYREVERHWSWRRDKQIIVSPLEFEAVEQWYEAEIPLPVVLRAIDLFLEKKKKSKRMRPYLLIHVDDMVAKVYREYQALHSGRSEDEGDLLGSKMKALRQKLQKLAATYPEEEALVGELLSGLALIDLAGAVHYQDLDEELKRLDEHMLTRFHAKLSAGERGAIREDVNDIMAEEEDPVFYRKLVHDSVRAHYGLPRLTLLG